MIGGRIYEIYLQLIKIFVESEKESKKKYSVLNFRNYGKKFVFDDLI